ncbi:MAG TPA: methyltransferase domain-containing protein [Bryobacteraceae bacterium]|jgi:2-polyprenyl-3-methyl-5-hydroxy-6-metoxy-1,4-benzoquinol methylase|nr:methyltransferase domain-containing protein [Bryobacteraceae bacterium]
MFRKNQKAVLCLLGGLLGFGVIPSRAQLAPRKADEWEKTLESPRRAATQKVDEVLSDLSLKPGMIVADIGAGSGFFSRPLAKAVSPGGKVYAVDIQQGLLDFINKRDAEEHIGNIQTVLGEFDDPKIPARNVDLAFINDVLHHIEHRAVYLKALGTYIKPGGRVAIIEMNKDDPNTGHKNQPELLVAREDIVKWMADAGFKLVEEHPDLFPGTKWFLIFGKK